MDLAILVYVISVLSDLKTVLALLTGAVGILLVLSIIVYVDYSPTAEETAAAVKRMKGLAASIVLLMFTQILIPTEKTAYTMVGAYAAQQVAENPQVQKMSEKVLKIIDAKLDTYVEEGVESVKNKAAKQLDK